MLALWALVSKVYPFIRGCWYKIVHAAHDKLFEELRLMNAKIDHVVHEVTDNDGSSLKDSNKRLESSLSYLKSYMKATLHTHDKAVFETNAEGIVTFVNKTFCDMTGFTEREVMGMGWVNLIWHNDRDRVIRIWNRAVTEEINFDENIRYVTKAGKPYPVHAIARIMRDSTTNQMMGHLGEIIPEEGHELRG